MGHKKPEADAILLDQADGVATALRTLKKGEEIRVRGGLSEFTVMATQDIPICHKIAITNIGLKDAILKHGIKIGIASRDIGVGCHVHVHNLQSDRKC